MGFARLSLGNPPFSGVAELATFDEEISKCVIGSLEKSETMLRELLRQGQDDGSIPAPLDNQSTARLMLCVLQGMRVIGKSGRSKKDMQAVADAAMKLLD